MITDKPVGRAEFLTTQAAPTRSPRPAMSPAARLVLASFLMLFLELALIRWAGSNVLYLSYFSNFLLLASFLGIGLGFLAGRYRVDLLKWGALLLGVLAFTVLAFPIEVPRPSEKSLIYFGGQTLGGPPAWVMLPLLFGAVAAIMMCVGQAVGRAFGALSALEAYRFDIVGSLLGIAVFTAISYLQLPPIAWAVIVTGCFIALSLPRPPRLMMLGQTILLAALLVESVAPMTLWSPYYKIQWVSAPTRFNEGTQYHFAANGVPHQGIRSVELIKDARNSLTFYLSPYETIHRAPGRELIIGAGTGTDVAIALDQGATSVDAVEIDPVLYALGRKLNGDAPYRDPRVHVHINDGRAFLEQSKDKYDLILLALPDSLTLVSGQSALRLESYLFTYEASQAFRSHLADDGVFAEYNYYRQPWLADRLAQTLAASYGQAPCVNTVSGDYGAGVAFLTESKDPRALTCSRWVRPSEVAPPVHDDRPFLYVRDRAIPSFYLWSLAGILLISFVAIALIGRGLRGWTSYLDLGFLGAAFLLLETKNVVGFALLFGTTWVVNSLVFAGILVMVLLAVEISRRNFKLPSRFLYAALAASLLIAYAIPTNALLALPLMERLAAAIAVSFTPVLIANLIFAGRLRAAASSTTAFAVNLLGALFGGVLEYSSIALGYQNLTLLVLALYGVSFALLNLSPRLAKRTP